MLAKPAFWPNVSWNPRLLSEVGFQDFDTLQEYLLQNLAKSATAWDASCPKHEGASCRKRRPSLVCQSWVSNDDFVDPRSGLAFAYDRRAPCCCRPWEFSSGDIFTVVAFMSPLKTAPGPWSPNNTPDIANMHIHWLMTYEAFDGRSHYGATVYNQNQDMQVNYPSSDSPHDFPFWEVMEAASSDRGGFPNEHVPITANLRLLLGYIWMTLFSWRFEFIGFCILGFFCCSACLFHLFVRCRRAKRARSHPAVVCASQAAPCCPDAAGRAAEQAVRCVGAVEHDE